MDKADSYVTKVIELHVSLLGSRSSSSIFIVVSLMTSLLSFIKLNDVVLKLVSLCLRVQCVVIISSCMIRLVYSWMRISAKAKQKRFLDKGACRSLYAHVLKVWLCIPTPNNIIHVNDADTANRLRTAAIMVCNVNIFLLRTLKIICHCVQ